MREKKRLEHVLATDADLARRAGDINAYFDLAKEGENVDADLQREITSLRDLIDKLETETLLSGENDERSAIVLSTPVPAVPSPKTGPIRPANVFLWAERRVCHRAYDYQAGEVAG